jgi:RNA-directed DNA polymerase
MRMMAHIAGRPAGHLPLIRPDWEWVERAVWTDRMLSALHCGVKGGKWHNLIDKVYAPRNLQRAYEMVAANKGAGGVDSVTVARYGKQLAHNQATLAARLRSGTYRPLPVRRIHIDKPGSADKRPLGIPCVRDRIAQRALKHVVEPIYEATFHPSSYGFRPQLGCKDALRELVGLLESGYTVVVDADIRRFFDAIPKPRLMERVREQVADGRVLDLIEGCLHQGVMEEMVRWDPATGTPQGAVISPLLANIFLNPFDWAMHGHGVRIVRYADDFVMLCRSRADAERALELAREWMAVNELELHPSKTRLVDMDGEGAEFSFLGYRFKRHTDRHGKRRILQLVSRKSTGKLRDTLRRHTSRCNAHGLPEILRRVNRMLRGWFNYFQHCFPSELDSVDQYVRRRLRRILRKRAKRGRGTGRSHSDHIRWPNAFFSELGYFSLADARVRALQSLRGTR